MNPHEASASDKTGIEPLCHTPDAVLRQQDRPLVSLVVPAYNEAQIIEKHLTTLLQYMASLEDEYCWEMIIVNDGSTDDTGKPAEAVARTTANVRVVHHPSNQGLGQALKSAFSHCQGEYVVTVDLDLSYSPDHIRSLLTKIRQTNAKIVVTSPYRSGGKISNVPWLRRTLSVWANRFLSHAVKGHLSTLTGMVRVYDRQFLQALDLRAMGMEINPEVIYKAMLVNARIEEIPAHLHWRTQDGAVEKRHSSMKVLRHTLSIILAGYLFRPVLFFIAPGLTLLALSLYTNVWGYPCSHSLSVHSPVRGYCPAFQKQLAPMLRPPHLVVGGMTLMLAMHSSAWEFWHYRVKAISKKCFILAQQFTDVIKRAKGGTDERCLVGARCCIAPSIGSGCFRSYTR
jgi:glycosyltransferase involved in cell wall biosynthesis